MGHSVAGDVADFPLNPNSYGIKSQTTGPVVIRVWFIQESYSLSGVPKEKNEVQQQHANLPVLFESWSAMHLYQFRV